MKRNRNIIVIIIVVVVVRVIITIMRCLFARWSDRRGQFFCR